MRSKKHVVLFKRLDRISLSPYSFVILSCLTRTFSIFRGRVFHVSCIASLRHKTDLFIPYILFIDNSLGMQYVF